METRFRSRKRVPAGPPRVPLSLHILNSVRLLWARQSSCVWARVSTNIAREVCSFFGLRRFLTCITRSKVITFDVDSLRVQEVFPDKALPFSTKTMRSTCVGEDQIFICGGYFRWALSLAFVLTDGVVSELTPMREPRFNHAVVHYEPHLAVYVFGGRSSSQPKKTAEVFSFLQRQWHALPKMKEERAELGACLYKARIYLCGGHARHCEVFDLRMQEFSSLPQCALSYVSKRFSFDYKGFCFMLDDLLVVFDSSKMRKFSTENYQEVGAEDWRLDRYYFEGAAIARDGSLYALNTKRGYRYDLKTHELLATVEIDA